jgi:hypothetical protein
MSCPECKQLNQAINQAYRQIVKANFQNLGLPIGNPNLQNPSLIKILGHAIEAALAHERLCPEAQALNVEHALSGD